MRASALTAAMFKQLAAAAQVFWPRRPALATALLAMSGCVSIEDGGVVDKVVITPSEEVYVIVSDDYEADLVVDGRTERLRGAVNLEISAQVGDGSIQEISVRRASAHFPNAPFDDILGRVTDRGFLAFSADLPEDGVRAKVERTDRRPICERYYEKIPIPCPEDPEGRDASAYPTPADVETAQYDAEQICRAREYEVAARRRSAQAELERLCNDPPPEMGQRCAGLELGDYPFITSDAEVAADCVRRERTRLLEARRRSTAPSVFGCSEPQRYQTVPRCRWRPNPDADRFEADRIRVELPAAVWLSAIGDADPVFVEDDDGPAGEAVRLAGRVVLDFGVRRTLAALRDAARGRVRSRAEPARPVDVDAPISLGADPRIEPAESVVKLDLSVDESARAVSGNTKVPDNKAFGLRGGERRLPAQVALINGSTGADVGRRLCVSPLFLRQK
ncbi:MAG: hypothetical protein AAGC56_09820, partial [Pseudomonadota bacterium]